MNVDVRTDDLHILLLVISNLRLRFIVRFSLSVNVAGITKRCPMHLKVFVNLMHEKKRTNCAAAQRNSKSVCYLRLYSSPASREE